MCCNLTIPQHPHCMCSLVTVTVSETKGQDKEFDADGVTKYIDGLSDKERRQLFGVKGAKEYRAGGDWQKLTRGWQGYDKPQGRLKSEDFNLSSPENINIIEPTKRYYEHRSNKIFANPNDVIDLYAKGYVDSRIIYDDSGRMIKMIHPTDHVFPKKHPFGEHGEHAHDISWDADSKRIKKNQGRELTDLERKEHQEILKEERYRDK